MLACLSVWSEVQMICIWFSWCHCHPIISCFRKIQNGLSFWYRPTQVVLEKKAIKCFYVCVGKLFLFSLFAHICIVCYHSCRWMKTQWKPIEVKVVKLQRTHCWQGSGQAASDLTAVLNRPRRRHLASVVSHSHVSSCIHTATTAAYSHHCGNARR